MTKMQTEFTSLNSVIQELLQEKRQVLKCRCRPRI